MKEKMKKVVLVLIVLGLILFVSTTVFTSEQSSKVYRIGEYEIKDEIAYETATNTKLNGIVKLYYNSGILKAEGNYKDGKLNGLSKGYYESGILEGERNYKDNKRSGIAKSYYESGTLESEVHFKDDRHNGVFKGYFKSGVLWFEVNIKNSKAISGILYHENGEKIRNMTDEDFTAIGLEY